MLILSFDRGFVGLIDYLMLSVVRCSAKMLGLEALVDVVQSYLDETHKWSS